MYRAALVLPGLLLHSTVFCQMVVSPGTSVVVESGTSLRIDAPLTWSVDAGASVVNDGAITLSPQTQLAEALGAAITGTGTERTTRELNAPLTGEDPGGLGGIITTNTALGTTLIVRGHGPQTDYSGHTSIARWIDISPTTTSGLNATLALRYDPSELNGLVETDQRLHIRSSPDVWWPLPSTVNTLDHTVTTIGMDSLGRVTTFDEDLPNTINTAPAASSFALLGASGQQLYLHVPAGSRAETVDVMASNGSLLGSFVVRWAEGLHALPMQDFAPGIYHLRINSSITLSFVRP